MINFDNVTKNRLSSIASNYAEALIEDRGNNIEDLASGFANAGFTKSEFFQILDHYYLSDYEWAEESEADKKVNIEKPQKAVRPWYAWDGIGASLEDEDIEDGNAIYILVFDIQSFKNRFDDSIILAGIEDFGVLYEWDGDNEEWKKRVSPVLVPAPIVQDLNRKGIMLKY